MPEPNRQSISMGKIAAVLFGIIAFAILVAFEPVKKAICAPYGFTGFDTFLAALRGAETNCVRGLLFDYQTLLAGILALGAAILTVRRMRRDDVNASDRHLQQMQLSRRPDRLKLEKNVLPWLPDLRQIGDELRFRAPADEWTDHRLSEHISTYLESDGIFDTAAIIHNLEVLLWFSQWREIDALIDYPIARLRERILDEIKVCTGCLKALPIVAYERRPVLPSVHEATEVHYDGLRRYAESMERAIDYPRSLTQLAFLTSDLHVRILKLLHLYDVEIDES